MDADASIIDLTQPPPPVVLDLSNVGCTTQETVSQAPADSVAAMDVVPESVPLPVAGKKRRGSKASGDATPAPRKKKNVSFSEDGSSTPAAPTRRRNQAFALVSIEYTRHPRLHAILQDEIKAHKNQTSKLLKTLFGVFTKLQSILVTRATNSRKTEVAAMPPGATLDEVQSAALKYLITSLTNQTRNSAKEAYADDKENNQTNFYNQVKTAVKKLSDMDRNLTQKLLDNNMTSFGNTRLDTAHEIIKQTLENEEVMYYRPRKRASRKGDGSGAAASKASGEGSAAGEPSEDDDNSSNEDAQDVASDDVPQPAPPAAEDDASVAPSVDASA